jgi:hypothetical protein
MKTRVISLNGGKRIQYSVSEVSSLGFDTRKKIPLPKTAKVSILKKKMGSVWKPSIKTIVRAKSDEFLLMLKPKQAYLFKILLIQLRKHPRLSKDEMNSLVMRTIQEQKGKEVKNSYPVYAADTLFRKAVEFGAIKVEGKRQ